ncbi:MAG: EamA family transporter [Anaerolineae bacterium]|nr:EamA family transporter [Anaerolineae bacterium]
MNPLAAALVLGSTFFHAGWNLLARRQRAEALFFYRLLLMVAAIGLIPAAVSEWYTRSLPPAAWLYALGSGAFCGFYYLFLAKGYAASDFTVVYPVARALPVLLVGLGDVLRGRYPTAMGWAGMLLVALGCLLAPQRSFRELSPRRYLNRASMWIILTALSTVGYTMLDKMASEIMEQGPGTAARYEYVFYIFSFLFYAIFLRITRRMGALDNAKNPPGQDIGWRLPLLGGLFNFGAYWLVLWAYQLSQRASYVVAFRQFSIVIGVVLAFLLYREEGRLVRITATLLITVGLVVIGMWGR